MSKPNSKRNLDMAIRRTPEGEAEGRAGALRDAALRSEA